MNITTSNYEQSGSLTDQRRVTVTVQELIVMASALRFAVLRDEYSGWPLDTINAMLIDLAPYEHMLANTITASEE